MHLIALWDGERGDGPGGTEHRGTVVQQHRGRAVVIATGSLA
ncbi:MAG: hypothetical protein QE285_05980 [Aquabacterium sp.]|nr:hypothetical protein [Aquabacterium sp.]